MPPNDIAIKPLIAKMAEMLATQTPPMTTPRGGEYLFPRDQGMYTPDVPQIALRRQQGRGGKYTPRMQALLDSRAAGRRVDELIAKAPDMKEWYGTEPLRQFSFNEGMEAPDYERMMAHLASASQRNPVDIQNRMGSYMWMLDNQGRLGPDAELLTNKLRGELKKGRRPITDNMVELPPGYGSLAQSAIFDRAKTIAGGDIDTALPETDKLGSFYRNLLGNLNPVTVDVNALRGPVIASKNPDWLVSKLVDKDAEGNIRATHYPRKLLDSGEMSMKEALARPGFWEAAPSGSEYGGFEKLWQRAAKRAGVEPAEAQAMGWYGSADITALKTKPELYVDNLERLIKRTADRRGQNPLDTARSFIQGSEPLYAAGGNVPRIVSKGAKLGSWAVDYLKNKLPEEYARQPITQLTGARGTGRAAFGVGDDYVAKLWNPAFPRGLSENAWQDGWLEDTMRVPTKHWISPDADISVSDRMQPNKAWSNYFIDPLQRRWFDALHEARASGDKQWPQRQYDMHQSDPMLRHMMDKRDLNVFQNYDVMGDFYSPEHWMQNPLNNMKGAMVDEGAMIPDLLRSHSDPKQWKNLFPRQNEIISDRLKFVTDAQRKKRMEDALARAREASNDSSPEAQAQVQQAQGELGFAGGGAVRNWLKIAGDDWLPGSLQSGYDKVMRSLPLWGDAPEVRNWFKSNLGNYIKRDFGSETDPLRALHAEGKLSFNDAATGERRPNTPDVYEGAIKDILTPVHAAKVRGHLSDRYIGPNGAGVMDADLPAWLREQRGSGNTFHDLSDQGWLDHFGEPVGQVADYLNQLPAAEQARLNKMSVPDAFRKAADWHESLAKQAGKTTATMEGTSLHKEYPTGYRWVKIDGGDMPTELPKDMQLKPGKHGEWSLEEPNAAPRYLGAFPDVEPRSQPSAMKKALELAHYRQLRDALNAEGCAMGHCVGSYADDVSAGGSHIYSLRDEKGQPHVTVEASPQERNRLPFSSLEDGLNKMEGGPEMYKAWQQNGGLNKQPLFPFLDERHPGVTDKLREMEDAYKNAVPEVKHDITQIRGKQNATPVSEYHPYIQDFIKSGQWGDVENPKRFGIRRARDIYNDAERKRYAEHGVDVPEWLSPEDAEALDKNWPVHKPTGFADGGMVGVDDAAANAAGGDASDAQREAGNYRKGHARIAGMPISIENEAGSKRRPEWPALQHHYGYFKGTTGKDKDHIDVFVKPGTPDDYAGPVHVVDQKKQGNGHFDEHKVMLGWDQPEEAHAAYRSNYTKDWDGIKSFSSWAMPDFKTWIANGDHTKEAAPQAQRYAKGGMVFDDSMARYTKAYGLPDGLVQSVMSTESAGKPDAVSPKGARGLMQLMPGTAKQLGVDADNPEENIEGGARYLRDLLKRFGDVRTALGAYNWGPGNVVTYGVDKMPKETRDYIARVFSKWMGHEPEKKKDSTTEPAPARIAAKSKSGEQSRRYEQDTMQEEAMTLLDQMLAPDEEEEEPITA